MHKARRAKLDRVRKVREAERVIEDEGENEFMVEQGRGIMQGLSAGTEVGQG